MNRIIIFSLIFFSFCSENIYSQDKTNRQEKYLNEVLTINIDQRFRANTRRISVQDSTWMDWLSRTGELPPDFSTMRSTPMLPEPLIKYGEGKDVPITTEKGWLEKREWIKSEYQHWISGYAPPAPGNVEATILKDTIQEGGARIQLIRLNFGPQKKAEMTFELMIPNGEGPFPVVMTQWNHRNWAQLAVKRDYIGCVYAGADLKDDTDSYMFLYPGYDFSGLMRRAWGASRVVDYLITREEVSKQQIAIAGHSRNGKQSLWAAAFDERIAAVVSSSSSTGGDAPWRYGDPQYASETLDYVTALNGHWFHPRLRFFFGNEDKLPVDQNLLGALIAPRPLLYHYSLVERGLNSWANEQNYYSVKKVYDFLNVPENVGVLTRMGTHAVAARDVEQMIDFLDISFKRIPLKWTNNLYYTYDYEKWREALPDADISAEKVLSINLKDNYPSSKGFERDKIKILENLKWILGEQPSGVRAIDVGTWNPPNKDWIERINPLPIVKGAKEIYLGPYTATGDHVPGVLYCPEDESGKIKTKPNGKLPVVIYSHQYAHSTGFSKGYDKDGRRGTKDLFESLIKRGFAVLAIDMYGFGARIEEAQNFYLRYPGWSKMGKMVRDVRGCIDVVEDLDYLDEEHIYLLGNTIGGSVSLITAALDDRVAGVATVAAFSPWRSSNDQYESVRTYSHLHGFIPRLGSFAGNPQTTPVDFGEIIASIAPKPVLIFAPELDRYTDLPALKKMIKPLHHVYGIYGKQDQLDVRYTPGEINRMTVEMYDEVGAFFSESYERDTKSIQTNKSIEKKRFIGAI